MSVDLEDLDLASLFAGQALSEEVRRRVEARGFGGLRTGHGYIVQRLVEGEQPIGALARDLGVTQQAVSKTVAELERLGYAERRPRPGGPQVRARRVRPPA